MMTAKQEQKPTTKAYILEVSDEILLEIFKYTVPYDSDEYDYSTRDSGLAVSKTCKRFYAAVQPLLYKDLRLGKSRLWSALAVSPPVLPAKLLCRTFREDRSLALLCRRLYVWFVTASSEPGHFRLAQEILPMVKNLTYFRVRADLHNADVWKIISKSINDMAFLRSLILENVGGGALHLGKIHEELELPNLQVLELKGTKSGDCYGGLLEPLSQGSVIPAEKKRKARFKHLLVDVPEHNPEDLKELLTWPRALEKFSFHETRQSRFNLRYTTAFFETALRPHHMSLQSISIGGFAVSPACIQLASFEKLESLQINFCNLDCTAEVAASSLLAPRLYSITFDFDDYADGYSRLDDFSHAFAQWLRRFVDEAKKHSSALCEVKVLFYEYLSCIEMDLASVERLWDRIKEVEDYLHQQGIKFTYQGPSRESVEQNIEMYSPAHFTRYGT